MITFIAGTIAGGLAGLTIGKRVALYSLGRAELRGRLSAIKSNRRR